MRIANPGAVYRSTNPDHLRMVEDNKRKLEEAADKANALADRLVPGAVAYGVRYDDGQFWMGGLKVESRDIDVPTGLRWDTKAKRGALVLVPAKRTDEGKALAKEMEATSANVESLGAVSEVIVFTDGTNRWFGQAVIEVVGDEVYATYHHPICDRKYGDKPSDREHVESDPNWEPVPLSEFYAAREKAA